MSVFDKVVVISAPKKRARTLSGCNDERESRLIPDKDKAAAPRISSLTRMLEELGRVLFE